MTTLTYNNFKTTTIRGAFNNSDYADGTELAIATFDRDVTVKNNIYLGNETSHTSGGVTSYTNTGSVIINYQGTTYTLTPSQIIQLSQTLASKDYVNQHVANNIINQIDVFVELVLLNQIDYGDSLINQVTRHDDILNQY
jgi:hypothetical protein